MHIDSSQETTELGMSGIIVRDRLPTALPLLPRGRLLSEPPHSLIELQLTKALPQMVQTQQQQLADYGQPHDRKSIMLNRLSDMLQQPQRIAYNILPKEEYALSDQSFGFHFFDKESESIRPQKIDNTGILHSLSFESRFESGNLLLAYEYATDHYLLVVRPDYNTTCYCQWFYFEVMNELQQPFEVTFSIVNMTKSASLFSLGMKVIALQAGSNGWVRTGQDISYTANQFPRNFGRYHTLSWRTSLQPGKPVRFSYSQPYQYSRLNSYLDTLESHSVIRRSILCRTMLNNRVDLLTISSGSLENKQVVVMVSRTHPAETVGSFVMRGVIEFLISDRAEAKFLRDKFVFKLIPMLNPDGVVLGNSRCSLKGTDLNRSWDKPSRKSDPEVYNLMKLIINYARSDRLAMFCDLHGHSKKKNIFAYGCHDRSNPYACRQLPFILSRIHKSFSFEDCSFAMSSCKQGTARVSLWRKLRIPNIFTLESSFCSAEDSGVHLDEKGYREMGEDLCRAINIYFTGRDDSKRDRGQLPAETHKLLMNMREQVLKQLRRDKELLKVGMGEDSGSESQEESGQVYRDIKQKRNPQRLPTSEVEVSKEEVPSLKTQRSQLLSYSYRKNNQTSLYDETSMTQHVHRRRDKAFSGANLMQKKPLLRRPNLERSLKPERQTHCFSENFSSKKQDEVQSPRPNLAYLKTSFPEKQKQQVSPIFRSDEKIVKYVPQFINFNFEQKFRKTTLEAQYRSKLARQNRDYLLLGEQTSNQRGSYKLPEQTATRLIQKRDQQKRAHQKSFIELHKQQPIGSRLENITRRVYK